MRRIKQSLTWRRKNDRSLVQLIRGIRTSPADQAALAPVKYLRIPLNPLEEWRNALREGRAPFPAVGLESGQGHFFPGSVRMDSDFLNFRDLEAGTTSELAAESPPEPTRSPGSPRLAWPCCGMEWFAPREGQFLTRTTGKLQVSKSNRATCVGNVCIWKGKLCSNSCLDFYLNYT